MHIIEAKGLVNKDSVVFGQGKSDPYATVEIRADAETHNFKTEVSLIFDCFNQLVYIYFWRESRRDNKT